ncbi:DUF6232 family protein [Streptomyces sp. NPDC048258]|uniref:DUF6232 family protein n=1 Tax=Streptomyces sp. NPDC048258 TaxID=3365527 RepID=UPI003724066B
MELRVDKRLLWVDGAAYPLHNIARVRTFQIRPDRGGAFLQFLKWLGVTAALVIVLQIAGADPGTSSGSDYGSDNAANGLWTLGIIMAVILFVRLLTQLAAPSRHVLSVETSGPSTALVTLPDKEQLRQLVGQIVYAIEHPETEFAVRVERLSINPNNYHLGDTVNMYGGAGNLGVVKK